MKSKHTQIPMTGIHLIWCRSIFASITVCQTANPDQTMNTHVFKLNLTATGLTWFYLIWVLRLCRQYWASCYEAPTQHDVLQPHQHYSSLNVRQRYRSSSRFASSIKSRTLLSYTSCMSLSPDCDYDTVKHVVNIFNIFNRFWVPDSIIKSDSSDQRRVRSFRLSSRNLSKAVSFV